MYSDELEWEPVPIREMPRESRPREKLYSSGAKSLTDAELLAIILGSGNRDMGALQLAEYLLLRFGDLRGLYEASIEELTEGVKGIGQVRAIGIKASLELGRRLGNFRPQKQVLRSAEDVKNLLMDEMRYFDREHVRILCLDQKNGLLGMEEISIGGLAFSLVHPREVFKPAIKRSCAAIILVHNHPSGDPAPSEEDIKTTQRIVKAGKIIGIDVADHVIIGDGKYYSLKTWGYL